MEYKVNGNNSVAVIEFESLLPDKAIGTDSGDVDYHTVVTVFEPDTMRDGVEFDYVEELLSNADNIPLTIERGHPARSATREIHPNTSSKLPSNGSISQNPEKSTLNSHNDSDSIYCIENHTERNRYDTLYGKKRRFDL